MADQKRVNIAHADGREYSIEPKAFTNAKLHPDDVGSYADQGFRIVNHVDGTPYDGPKTKQEIDKTTAAREAERAERAARPSAPAKSRGD